MVPWRSLWPGLFFFLVSFDGLKNGNSGVDPGKSIDVWYRFLKQISKFWGQVFYISWVHLANWDHFWCCISFLGETWGCYEHTCDFLMTYGYNTAPITEDLDVGKIAAETVYGHFKLLVVWCGLHHFLVYIPLGLSPMTFIRLEDTNDKLGTSMFQKWSPTIARKHLSNQTYQTLTQTWTWKRTPNSEPSTSSWS